MNGVMIPMQETPVPKHIFRHRSMCRNQVTALYSAVVALSFFASNPAVSMEISNQDWSATFDTTLTTGILWRVQDQNPALVDRYNGGAAQNALNSDDGNINFDPGIVSAAVMATHDLELKYGNFGAFARAFYFYDPALDKKDALSEVAKQRTARNFDLLDAYLFADLRVGERPLSLRAGNQVINWGESSFIGNGISVINPVDVSKLRVPGSEVREALIPSPMVWASADLSPHVSVEAIYLAGFKGVRLEPKGTFFSVNDGITDGADHIIAGFGVADESGNIPNGPALPNGFFIIPRNADQLPSDYNQYGAAIRWFSPLFSGTELGVYFINYHSRLPLVSFVSGINNTPANGGGPYTARYFVEYPEDIQLLGFSFNTIESMSGVAVQAELSYRDNVPLQIEFAEVAMAATHTQITPGVYASQLGEFADGALVTGFQRLPVAQGQMTLTKAFGRLNPVFADDWTVAGEFGATRVFDMPDESSLRFEAPGTNLPARNDIVVAGRAIPAQTGGYATRFSWGYRALTSVTYNNVVAGLALTPRFVFSHDVRGTTPGPGGNFVEDRKSLTAGAGATYREQWAFDASYTKFFGAEGHNDSSDRDFAVVSAKYGF